MSDVYLYLVDLPRGIHEMVSPGWEDDYTVYVDKNLTYSERVAAIAHAIKHMRRDDFNREDVQQIEKEAHGG